MSKPFPDSIKELNDYFQNAPKIDSYEVEKITACAVEFFKRLPYRVGMEVVLAVTPDINEKTSWGWMGSKHFLKKGAKGKIKEIDFYKGKVRLGIEIYNQTFIHTPLGKNSVPQELPIKNPHLYTFSEDDVILI